MKHFRFIIVKYMIGYLVNSIFTLLFVLVMGYLFKLDACDSILIGGALVLLIFFLTMNNYTRSMPAMSPVQHLDRSDGFKGDSIINIAAEAMIDQQNTALHNQVIKNTKHKAVVQYFLFVRSKVEVLTYAVVLIVVGLIKYYSYFI